MKIKKALITGINGQDGAYLAKLLLEKNYDVFGLLRRSSNYKLQRLDYLGIKNKIKYFHSELNEYKNIEHIILKIKPDVIYNLGAQSFVQYSFGNPTYTFEINFGSVLNMLEVIVRNKLNSKFYQASTSEMYGNSIVDMQNETTLFNPASPYAISKLSSHYLIKNYRESFDKFFCSGILFNHESFLRGIEFVTKKIVNGLVNIYYNNGPVLKLGNLDSYRDWGHAEDYVKAMYLIMNSKTPEDYVVASGKTYSIRQFIKKVCKLMNIKIEFKGKGINEVCIDKNNQKKIISIDKKYFRINELHRLKGNPQKIKNRLKWKPKFDFDNLVEDMVKREIDNIKSKSKIIF